MAITYTQLTELVDRINRKMGQSTKITDVGNFHLSLAYGGVALHQLLDSSGSTKDVLETGHVTKRELHGRLDSFLRGLEVAQNAVNAK